MKLRQWHYCERCASFDITNCYIKTKLPLAILFQWFLAAKDAKGAKELGPHARCHIVCPLSFVVRPLTFTRRPVSFNGFAATSFAEATVVKKNAKIAKKWKTSDY